MRVKMCAKEIAVELQRLKLKRYRIDDECVRSKKRYRIDEECVRSKTRIRKQKWVNIFIVGLNLFQVIAIRWCTAF